MRLGGIKDIGGVSSLNPYCNGRYSMRVESGYSMGGNTKVLILIVMEDTLWVRQC